MKSPKISVIVPVFNRENTITTCIEGISNTDYVNYEIIIIDDGSTDNSLQICRQLAARNSRIRVFHQHNAGVSSARNLGIRNATGDYLIFVDSDDTLFPNALDIIAKQLEQATDLLMFTAKTVSAENSGIPIPPLSSSIPIVQINGNVPIINWIYSEYNKQKDDYYFLRTKAFKSDLIRNNRIVFCEDVSLGEDQIFICEYLKHTNSLIYTGDCYVYELKWPQTARPNGLGSILRTPANFLHNQIKNYSALVNLYQHSALESVKKTAEDYILDRPVTRILFRHLCIGNKSRSSISEIIAFTAEKIKPIIEQEREGIPRQKNKHVRRILQLIISGYVRTAVWYAFLIINKGSVYRTLKRLLRAK